MKINLSFRLDTDGQVLSYSFLIALKNAHSILVEEINEFLIACPNIEINVKIMA